MEITQNKAELERINKFIASYGKISRRTVDEYILQGRITVNGITITEPGFRINPEKDKVCVDSELIKTDKRKLYILLYKPQGVISSVSDEKRRKTVVDIIKTKSRIFPVGRLDYNTTGLLILTNDGEFANKLMHPKYKVAKTYIVKLSKLLEEKHKIKLMNGIVLDGRKTSPCKISFPKRHDFSTVSITIHEGRNHQVKDMFEFYGYFVRDLHRSEYAGLNLRGLKLGEWRNLTDNEIKSLTKNIN
jgi:pseudouridine synthase